jgi:hypothetical protein
MSDPNANLVYQIKKQSSSIGMENALLLGAFYESSIGADASAWYPGGVPDVGGQSYGPFFFRDPGALNDVMTGGGGQPPNNMTQAQAGAWITEQNAVNAVQAAENRYNYVAQTQGINPNASTYEAMRLATQSEVGVGEQNALASGSWQSVYTQYVKPLVGKAGNQPPTTTGNPPPGQLPGGKIGPPAPGFPGSPQLPYGPPAPGFPGSPGYTGITTANPPATYPGMSSQMAATLDQQMNPVVHASGTDTQGATKPAAGIISDVEGFLTGGIIGSDQYAPLHMILGVNLKGAAENVVDAPINNAWNAVKAGLVRFGIGIAGLMLMAAGLFIIVMGVSGGGGGMPMPVPVPV